MNTHVRFVSIWTVVGFFVISALLVLLAWLYSIPSQGVIPQANERIYFSYEVEGCANATEEQTKNFTEFTQRDPSLSVSGNTVTYTRGAEHQCCLDVDITQQIAGSLITLTEQWTGEGCRCMCGSDLTATIEHLPAGAYQVEVFYIGNKTLEPEKIYSEDILIATTEQADVETNCEIINTANVVQCTLCGDGICHDFEQACVASGSARLPDGGYVQTDDCGPWYCPDDCEDVQPEEIIESNPSLLDLFNGSVPNMCQSDTDCMLVNAQLDFTDCCTTTYTCSDMRDKKYVAVNRYAFETLKNHVKPQSCDYSLCPQLDVCQVLVESQPMVPACENNVCVKK